MMPTESPGGMMSVPRDIFRPIFLHVVGRQYEGLWGYPIVIR